MRKIKVQGLFVVTTLTLCMVVLSAHAQTYSDLYNFGDASGDPINPQYSGIIAQGRDGNLYSTTPAGGGAGLGTVFNITAQGAMSVLYNFDGTHGKFPYGRLTLGTDGNFYGTTSVGGSTNLGVIFKITPAGALTVRHTFASGDGITPYAPPIQAADGNFYGTTAFGGASGYGAVYKIMPTGAYTVLHSFDLTNGSDLSVRWFKGTTATSTERHMVEWGTTDMASYSKLPATERLPSSTLSPNGWCKPVRRASPRERRQFLRNDV